ncbi:P-loop containing nucleoside triphosphate hydrolase protein [Panaeolus papilionaceus]|nr:P-loop containing nucleoside triphosphate hydrolase protein [Panaeolus papilionaceus]
MQATQLVKQGKYDVKPNDIIIAVMGPTGTGKSHLIEKYGRFDWEVNIAQNDLESQTKSVCAYRVKNHPRYGGSIVLVDTPGFDDSELPDLTVLKMISRWLKKTYAEKETRLAGILYLYRVNENRVTGTIKRNLKMFGELCGKDASEKVILIATMWDKADARKREARLDEFRSRYWKIMLENGSRVEVFYNTNESAQHILNKVIEREKNKRLLNLQYELVDMGKSLKETGAGMALCAELRRIMDDQQKALDELLRNENMQADPKLLTALQDQRQQVERELKKTLEHLDELKIGFFAKLFSLLNFKKRVSRGLELGQ